MVAIDDEILNVEFILQRLERIEFRPKAQRGKIEGLDGKVKERKGK